jgi:hypothetical protein
MILRGDLVNQPQIVDSDLERKAPHPNIQNFLECVEVRLYSLLIEVYYDPGLINTAEVELFGGRLIVILNEGQKFISFLLKVSALDSENIISLPDDDSKALISYDSTEESASFNIEGTYKESSRGHYTVSVRNCNSTQRVCLNVS